MRDSRPTAGIVHVTPGNDLPLHAARAAVTEIVRRTCAEGGRKLLVDFRDWTGTENPSLALRIDSVFEWSAAASGVPGFAMALVMPPQMVDPGKIGFIIGRRLGFDFDVFGDVDDARAWLESDGAFPEFDGG